MKNVTNIACCCVSTIVETSSPIAQRGEQIDRGREEHEQQAPAHRNVEDEARHDQSDREIEQRERSRAGSASPR